jgi:hypothetical protein
LFRSLAHPKTFAFVGTSVAATAIVLGCGIRDGELELPVPWNEEDHSFGRCVGQCTPDYGPRPITTEECARVEMGLEFFPEPVWDWEGQIGTPDEPQAYAYQDGTTEFLSTNTPTCTVETAADLVLWPAESNCQAEYTPTPALVDRCGSTRALHVRGGPFREWGGGLGKRLDNLARAAAENIGSSCGLTDIPPEDPDPSRPAFCPKLDPHVQNAPGVVIDPATDDRFRFEQVEPNYYAMRVDLREWDGISFWARRGPDSQPGFRIALGDRNIDDDPSMLETAGGIVPRCRRAKECGCKNHRPCNPGPDGELYCWDPTLDVHPNDHIHPWNHEPARCGYSQCNNPYAAYENVPDWPFLTPETDLTAFRAAATASCNSFTFQNDITRDYCFDKNGPMPPEGFERCGDPWFSPVRLSENWQFFRVPFTELRQEGYGKEFPAIDLSAITMVRFTWTVGWVDYWIDDVRFYRRQR